MRNKYLPPLRPVVRFGFPIAGEETTRNLYERLERMLRERYVRLTRAPRDGRRHINPGAIPRVTSSLMNCLMNSWSFGAISTKRNPMPGSR